MTDTDTFAPHMAKVATKLLGSAGKSFNDGATLRWGTHGSFKLDTAEGVWHDKEAGRGGGVLDLVMWKRGCSKGDAIAWLEAERVIPALDRTFYDYCDEHGVIMFRVERCKPGSRSRFLQHGPDGAGGFHCKSGCMKGVRRVPYRLPEITAADAHTIIFVCEGEKDVDRLAGLGLVATTNPEGAGKFATAFAPYFAGRRVVILEDNDQAGRDHGADVVAKLRGVATVAIVRLPDLPEKGDVSDWLDSGGTARQLVEQFAIPALQRAKAATASEPVEHDREAGEIFERDESDATARREAQRKANVEIGEGTNFVETAKIYTVDQMIDGFVFIRDGSQVAPLERPQAVLALADFKNAVAGSKHWTVDPDGKKKALKAATVWLEHPKRKDTETLTFKAGGTRIVPAPNSGMRALNLWTPTQRPQAPADWQARSADFVEHVRWLWGADADPFLDWLAHIEQQPGTLPHYGWVHISRGHGKGRNWISSVLTRVWSGYVAASLDLIPILEGGFNGRVSRKMLAIVDEINEGGSSSYKHAQKLRQLVTEEHRDINPKYGRQRVEYNACRWLMFSNHTGALPLTEDDRRFWVVAHEGEAKSADYYTRLYRQVSDPQFIASVAEFLSRRDIRNFRPGERPPMNSAKSELIAFSQTEDDATLKTIVAKWPVDIITAYEITDILGDGGPSKPAVRHAMDRAGIRKLASKIRLFEQGVQNVYVLRDFEKWAAASVEKVKSEHNREDESTKRDSLEADNA